MVCFLGNSSDSSSLSYLLDFIKESSKSIPLSFEDLSSWEEYSDNICIFFIFSISFQNNIQLALCVLFANISDNSKYFQPNDFIFSAVTEYIIYFLSNSNILIKLFDIITLNDVPIALQYI